MNRNSQASLSPSELASLRGVGQDSKRQIPDGHRQVLVSMRLVVADGDELRLTEAGHQRLTLAERAPNREGQNLQGSP
jgi:hypothetical protein